MRIVEAVLLGVLMIFSTAACGQDTAAVDEVPELSALLEKVDAAVVTGDDARIRRRVDDLMAATNQALESGDLDPAQAAKILSAAEALLSGLSSVEPSPSEESSSATPPPGEASSPPPEPEKTDTGDHGKPEKSGHGKGAGKGKKKS